MDLLVIFKNDVLRSLNSGCSDQELRRRIEVARIALGSDEYNPCEKDHNINLVCPACVDMSRVMDEGFLALVHAVLNHFHEKDARCPCGVCEVVVENLTTLRGMI